MHLSKRTYAMVGGSVLLAVALGVAAATLPNRSRLESATVPQDASIHVTLDQAFASDQSRPGEHFEATVSEPVLINGKAVIPQGAHAEGLVVDARRSGRLKGRARLQLALETVTVNGQSYGVRTSSSWRTVANHKNRTWSGFGAAAGGG